MAYDKHTWISGETITATELNDMESGIENNSERLDELTETVNKNTTDIDGKLDKSSVTSSLTSTSTTDALSASAGKTLNDALANYQCNTVPNGLTSPSLPTGIYAFSGSLGDAPDGLPGIIINTQTSGYQRQLVISGGSDQGIHIYARNRYKNGSDPWPSWTTIAPMLFKDVTGTTSAGGNITLDLNPATYMVTGLRVGSSSQGIALPWSAGSSWYVRVLNTDGTVKANTAVTIRVEYKKLAT